MKELFERHRPRMTPDEDRELWGRLEQKLARPRSRWQAWRIPAGATALATAAVAVVVLVRGTGVPRPGIQDGLEVRDVPLAQKSTDARREAPAAAPELAPKEADTPPPSSSPIGRLQAGNEARENEASGLADAAAQRVTAQDKLSIPLDLKTQVNASAGTITGRVTNDRGEGLAFAAVIITGTSLGAMTDTAGVFTIANVSPGKHALNVSYLGYESARVQLTLEAGATLAENVTLSETVVATMEQVMAESNSEVARRDGSTPPRRVGSEELEKLPKDAFKEATGLKSGVVSQAGKLHFRGGRSGEVQYQIEGIPVSDPLASGRPISVGGTDPVNGQDFDAMFFEHYGVNPFIDPQDDRFSTFAVDVDNASYSLARSYFQRGTLPPKEAIRVEEFVNSFKHDYAPPRGDLVASREWGPSEHGTFAIHLEAAPSPFGKDLVLLRVGLKGKEISVSERKPAVLTFVVDVSGSMQQENRLELVKRALGLLLDQMDRRDRVALVVYGSNARVILPHTSLAERRVIEDAINRLHPEGATNAEAGLREGYTLADRSFERGYLNRVILCSDGVANVGRTGAEDILQVIKTEARRGIYLTTVGFGMGNYNDVLMEKLANQGDGNYYYVDDLGEARRVFVENLTGTLQTIARDTKIQVEFDPDQVRRYRLLGYENRDVADRDFRNDAVDAGEVGAGHEVTALYEMKLDRGAKGGIATVRIRYEDPETGKVTEEARTLRVEDVNRRLESADPSFRLDAAVAEFAEILRHSYWAKDGDLARVHGLARQASNSLAHPEEAREVLSMIETADRLWPASGPTPWRDDVRPQWEPSMDDDER